MISRWQAFLDLRRDAEQSAQQAAFSAGQTLVKAQEEQARLLRAWHVARSILGKEEERLSRPPAPSTAAQGAARERYLGRLRAEVERLKAVADEHAGRALDAAQAAQRRASAGLERAIGERAAATAAHERARATSARRRWLKAEDAASDAASSSRATVSPLTIPSSRRSRG